MLAALEGRVYAQRARFVQHGARHVASQLRHGGLADFAARDFARRTADHEQTHPPRVGALQRDQLAHGRAHGVIDFRIHMMCLSSFSYALSSVIQRFSSLERTMFSTRLSAGNALRPSIQNGLPSLRH